MPRMGPAARSPPPQPPPPPPPHPRRCSASSLMGGVMDHHSNAPSKEEGNTSVVGGNRRRAYYFRRCKKVQASNMESLPNEVLSEILVRLSADEICEKARFVCRNWYHIIHSDAFVSAHLHHHRDNWGLLLSSGLFNHDRPVFLALRQGQIEITKLYRVCKHSIPASSNGLVLWREFSKLYTIYIVNLATKQAFSLPPSHLNQVYLGRLGIAYAAASMVYKVVRTYKLDHKAVSSQCDILTAGVDNNWRCVVVDNLSCGAKKLLLCIPLITPGFMHWTWKSGGTHVLTLNVETEMFTESYVPLCQEDADDDNQGWRRRRLNYLSTGRRLSLLFARRDLMWEVWEMEAESGEWRKLLPNINLEAHKWRIEQDFSYQYCEFLMPLGWVKYPVLLGLCFCGGRGRTCFVYNLHTDEIDSIELPHPCQSYRAVVHRNTLEWLS